jgi:hypothetical protein
VALILQGYLFIVVSDGSKKVNDMAKARWVSIILIAD